MSSLEITKLGCLYDITLETRLIDIIKDRYGKDQVLYQTAVAFADYVLPILGLKNPTEYEDEAFDLRDPYWRGLDSFLTPKRFLQQVKLISGKGKLFDVVKMDVDRAPKGTLFLLSREETPTVTILPPRKEE